MAWCLTWRHLSLQQIYAFNDLVDQQEQAITYLSQQLGLKDDEQGAILGDFYYYALRFAGRQPSFTPAKTSTFFSMLKQTLERIIESPGINVEKDYAQFRDTLLLHCVQRPPYSEKLFEADEMKAVNQYALDTCFQHYLLYKYSFTKKTFLNFTATLEPSAVDATDSEAAAAAPAAEPAAAAVPGDAAAGPDADAARGEAPLPGIERLSHAQKTEKALAELRVLISSAINDKVDDLRATVERSIQAQHSALAAQVEQLVKSSSAAAQSAPSGDSDPVS